MEEKVTILIYLRDRVSSKGENPIYMRITVGGKRKEKSLNRSILSSRWDRKKQRGKGRSQEIGMLNEYLNSEINKIYRKRQDILQSGGSFTVETLMNLYSGVEDHKHTLIEIFENENKMNKDVISEGTYKKYISLLNHVKSYLKFQYNVTDIDIKKIDYEFVITFDNYLRKEKSIQNNTTVKYVNTLRKIVKSALDKEWIEKDPFLKYKGSKKKVEREFLSDSEIKSIVNKDLPFERIKKARDIFVFCIYTGLAYSDVKSLTDSDIIIDINGGKMINIKRKKTNTVSNIPILPVAQEIIDRYKDHPETINSNRVLPVTSNQKMNAYLKEIADLCGINKNLTTHMARHTFATTITLSNNVPIETVSKMLGHSSLGITQHYAKVLTPKISNDMAVLKKKLADDEEKEENDSKEAI